MLRLLVYFQWSLQKNLSECRSNSNPIGNSIQVLTLRRFIHRLPHRKGRKGREELDGKSNVVGEGLFSCQRLYRWWRWHTRPFHPNIAAPFRPYFVVPHFSVWLSPFQDMKSILHPTGLTLFHLSFSSVTLAPVYPVAISSDKTHSSPPRPT